jgi:hypothetical protein
MAYSALLVSEKTGVGKTTLAEILAHMVGLHNVAFPSAETITKANFNRWAVFKRLVVIAEIYAGHSAKTFNTLKSTITDGYIEVNIKYMSEFDILNWVHFYATSNSFNALKIDDHDRRWFVPGVTEHKKPLQYFVELRRWLEEEGGYEIIAHWAQNYVQQEGGQVLAGEHAPSSATKRQVIEEAYAEGERLVLHWGRALTARTEPTVVRLDDVRTWLAAKKGEVDPQHYGTSGKRFLETARKISAILQNGCGLHVPSKQFDGERGVKLRVVANFVVPETATWGELKAHCIAAQTFDPM